MTSLSPLFQKVEEVELWESGSIETKRWDDYWKGYLLQLSEFFSWSDLVLMRIGVGTEGETSKALLMV